MRRRIGSQPTAVVAALVVCTNVSAQQPVIPDAAGFGMNTPAGRGGKIIRVTNLNDSGQGSLRACIAEAGPRYCVFEVSGVIRLATDLTITNPNLTIAGQTAPAPGVTLRGVSVKIRASDVLMQHLAVRPGDDPEGPSPHARDALKIAGESLIKDIVVDHCSFSWAVDENISTFKKWDNVTISNSIISEPLRDSISYKGPSGRGVLIDGEPAGGSIAMIGNLLAHNFGRNPMSNASDFVLVNNVIYNPAETAAMLFNTNGVPSDNSLEGNVFIDGLDTNTRPLRLVGPTAVSSGTELLAGTRLYLADNVAPGVTDDQWALVYNKSTLSRTQLEVFSAPVWPDGLEALPTEGQGVFDHVLQNAGSRPAQRDVVDERVVTSVKEGTGRIINCVSDDGTSRCSKNAGGWPKFPSNTRRLDVPADPHADDDGDGYTNVEEWLHIMAAEVEGRSHSPEPGTHSPPNPPVLTH